MASSRLGGAALSGSSASAAKSVPAFFSIAMEIPVSKSWHPLVLKLSKVICHFCLLGKA